MKRCPTCNRDYADPSLRFCLDDGTPLIDATYGDSPRTQVIHRAAPSDPSVATVSAQRSHETVRSELHEKRGFNPILTVGVVVIALLLMALVAIAGYFVFKQTRGDEKDKSSSNQTERNGNKKAASDTKPVAEPSTDTNTTDLQNSAPLKINASASSVRLAVQSNTYYPANAIDGKRTTAWIEGEEFGPGLGEWIRFDFDREITLHRILFQPGYFKSPQIWAQNNRLGTVTAQFSDGSSRELNFADRMESQKIDIGSVRTRWVKFVIKSVYYGTDPDTAISEVAFEWEQ